MTTAHRTITGRVVLSRVHLLRFPAYTVTGDEGVLAEIGRFGWFRIFFGPGQRIRLPDGTRWRLKSIGRTRYISPLIVNDEGLRVAEAAPGIKKAYGINGPDYAFTLYPATAGWGRPRTCTGKARQACASTCCRATPCGTGRSCPTACLAPAWRFP